MLPVGCAGAELVDHVDDVRRALLQMEPAGLELAERGEVVGEEDELLGALRETLGDLRRDAGEAVELRRELAERPGDLVLEQRQ